MEDKTRQVSKPNQSNLPENSDYQDNKYIPNQTDVTTGYTTIPEFKYWVQTVLPQVYDDALSYQELLYRVVAYLNIMNDNNNLMSEDVKTFVKQFNQLVANVNSNFESQKDFINASNEEVRKYINNYFNDLDVTTEINNKLSEMAKSGTFNVLWDSKIKQWATTSTQEWLDENITQPTGVVIDKTLKLNGACAEAKTVGEKLDYTFNVMTSTPPLNGIKFPTENIVYGKYIDTTYTVQEYNNAAMLVLPCDKDYILKIPYLVNEDVYAAYFKNDVLIKGFKLGYNVNSDHKYNPPLILEKKIDNKYRYYILPKNVEADSVALNIKLIGYDLTNGAIELFERDYLFNKTNLYCLTGRQGASSDLKTNIKNYADDSLFFNGYVSSSNGDLTSYNNNENYFAMITKIEELSNVFFYYRVITDSVLPIYTYDKYFNPVRNILELSPYSRNINNVNYTLINFTKEENEIYIGCNLIFANKQIDVFISESIADEYYIDNISGAIPVITDKTLKLENVSADAKTVGGKFDSAFEKIDYTVKALKSNPPFSKGNFPLENIVYGKYIDTSNNIQSLNNTAILILPCDKDYILKIPNLKTETIYGGYLKNNEVIKGVKLENVVNDKKQGLPPLILEKKLTNEYIYYIIPKNVEADNIAINVKVYAYDLTPDFIELFEKEYLFNKTNIDYLTGKQGATSDLKTNVNNYSDNSLYFNGFISTSDGLLSTYKFDKYYAMITNIEKLSNVFLYYKQNSGNPRNMEIWTFDNYFTPVRNIAKMPSNQSNINGINYSLINFEREENEIYIGCNVDFNDANTSVFISDSNTEDYYIENINGAITQPIAKEIVPTTKTWYALGDSITEKNFRFNKNYVDFCSESLNLNAIDLGISGNGYKNGDKKFIYEINQITTYNVETDVITIMGSVNDLKWVNNNLGTLGDNTDDTLYGAMYNTLNTLFTKFIGCRIGIISLIPFQDANKEVVDKYMKALTDTCELFNIPFLDLYHTSNLQPNKEEFRNKFFKSPKTGAVDGTHPNDEGHMLIYGRIKSFLESL